MPIFFIDKRDMQNNQFVIEGSDAGHLINSLRIKKGEQVKVSDGNFLYKAVVKNIENQRVYLEILKNISPYNQITSNIILCIGMIKFDKFEQIIKWGTAMGVKEFYPMITENSQNFSISDNKKERWRRIIRESAMQSENIYLPKLNDIIEYEKSFQLFRDEQKIILHPYANIRINQLSIDINRKIVLYIGSESGFTEKEIETAVKYKSHIARLPGNILRTELAAIVAVGLVTSLFGAED